ncbi:unnamed protein product [Sphenostylis stenocarpa]|uniref:Uncharacterized protein n=1 Tax=Sphenostylis stenocarpa TaxID=92480 RepID=A0AA86W2P1_9FABA|nr:unnamed protein product [Sphenostylis stenocarpa]
MIKRFPSRNHRSKGIKVKHVLQILLLLGVCFWLVYQVKHNHDKKKEFDKKDAKFSVSAQTDPILKLGRRDLHPGKQDKSQNEKHEEEEEDEHIEDDEENKHDHEEQEDGSKHEIEERGDIKHEGREHGEEENKHGADQEEDENKNEDVEDEGRGGGDDDIDENDQEKSEVDTTDRDDEFLDEEKEKEEEADEKENENVDEEKDGLVENHNNHEAREEHYKGDDASSAVAHDTHATSFETETLGLENSDVNSHMNITKSVNEATYSDESVRNQNDSDLKGSEGNSSNETAVEETGNNTLSNPVDDSSFLNQTTTTNFDSHLESSSNLIVVTTEANNNLTGAGNDTIKSSEQDKTVIKVESDQAQSTTNNTTNTGDVKIVQTEGLEQSGNGNSEEKLHNTDSAGSVKTENGDAAAGKSSNLVASNVTENTHRNEKSESDISESDKSKGNNETNETQTVDARKDESSKGDLQTGETDETSDSSSANETLDSAEQDPIDSSDSGIHEDSTEARTDLDTLPDIRNKGDDSDESAAE